MKERTKGRVTIPTDLDVVPETLELLERWGADAIRDCDGTDYPEELKNADAKVYSTYYTTLISVTQEIIKREYRNAYKPWKLLMFPGFFISPETLWNVVKRGEICSGCNTFATRLQQSYSSNVLFMASTSICTSRCV